MLCWLLVATNSKCVHVYSSPVCSVPLLSPAFRRIKEATGVADVNEVITKFLTQEETYQNLLQLQQEAQATIDRLQNEKVRRLCLAAAVRLGHCISPVSPCLCAFVCVCVCAPSRRS